MQILETIKEFFCPPEPVKVDHEIINHPKFKWAQDMADITEEQHALVVNGFGELDIIAVSKITPILSSKLIVIVEPSQRETPPHPFRNHQQWVKH